METPVAAAGIYISVPFCKTKCTYCNFASGVFSKAKYRAYVDQLCADIVGAHEIAAGQQAEFVAAADSIYFGGGTPTILPASHIRQIFAALRARFDVARDAEITVECAPGTLGPEVLDVLLACGVNRISLGVQSFADEEARAVGRLHTRDAALRDVEVLRRAGIADINLDLIAGLPHQSAQSWQQSLDDAISTGVPHVSVYMLEVDEDSRLGTELLAGGARYHAHHVPDDDLIAELYEIACERLSAAGLAQYEISNFASRGHESRHNLKYWTRQPYFGFGVDAHSMLPPGPEPTRAGIDAIRFGMGDTLEAFLSAGNAARIAASSTVSIEGALEEELFLGLRLNRGVDLAALRRRYSSALLAGTHQKIAKLCSHGLLQHAGIQLQLTPRGRLLSNEVFAEFLAPRAAPAGGVTDARARHELHTAPVG